MTSCGCDIGLPTRVSGGHKLCTKCRSTLPLSFFSKSSVNKGGYYSHCRNCTRIWRKANSNYLSREKKQYAKKHAAVIKKRRLAYYNKNKKALLQKTRLWAIANRERRKQIARDWVKRNPAYGCHQSNKRRAALLRAIPSWADLETIKKVYAEANAKKLVVDHIVPLQSKVVCGLHCQDNLQIISALENAIKNNRYWPDMP